MTAPFPSHRDEAWRYADLAALQSAWPLAAPGTLALTQDAGASECVIVEGGVRRLRVELAPRARLSLALLNMGPVSSRIEIDARLEAGSLLDIGAIQIAAGAATHEVVTRVTHGGAGGVSRQVVRNVAGGSATANYLGKVAVERTAQQTDSTQSVKSLLLTRGAAANSKPELEIFADDVKCAHGATVGALDRAALFYLLSRGIPPADARALLLQSFIADALDAMDAGVRDAVAARVMTALEAVQ